jgi:hypothetical protein
LFDGRLAGCNGGDCGDGACGQRLAGWGLMLGLATTWRRSRERHGAVVALVWRQQQHGERRIMQGCMLPARCASLRW